MKSDDMSALRAAVSPRVIKPGMNHSASDSAYEAHSAIYIAFAVFKISIGIIFKSVLRFLVKGGGTFFPAQFRKSGACLAAFLLLAQPVFALDVEPVSSPLPVSRTEAPAGKNAADKTNHSLNSPHKIPDSLIKGSVRLIEIHPGQNIAGKEFSGCSGSFILPEFGNFFCRNQDLVHRKSGFFLTKGCLNILSDFQ